MGYASIVDAVRRRTTKSHNETTWSDDVPWRVSLAPKTDLSVSQSLRHASAPRGSRKD